MVVGKHKAAPSVSQQREQGVLSRHANQDRTRERIALKREPPTFTATVAGTVQRLVRSTEAQALTVILPDSARVTLENKDIGFVSPGQDVAIKLETFTFTFTRYGPATLKLTLN